MSRKIAGLLLLPLLTLLFGITAPGVASAVSASACTSSTTFETYKWKLNGNGLLEPVGTFYHSFVGTSGVVGPHRVWHVTYRANGSPLAAYSHAYAVRCDADGAITSDVDLTRTADQTLDEFDLRCGSADFTTASTAYHLVGSRTSWGTTFRYWGTRNTSGQFLLFGVTAARCP